MSRGLTELKSTIENTILFCRKLENKNLANKLDVLLLKYGQNIKAEQLLFKLALKTKDQYSEANTISDKEFLGKLNWMPTEFFHDVESLLKDFELGQEWWISLVVLLLSGKMAVPRQNFYIPDANEKLANDPTRVILVLNPNTTIDDIKLNFNKIRKEQKKRFPKYKQRNFTYKTLRNYRIHLTSSKSFRERMALAPLLHLPSEYENHILQKNIALEEKLKIINKSRKENRKKPLKLKKMISMRYLITEYATRGSKPNTKKEIARRIANMRQINKHEKRDSLLM